MDRHLKINPVFTVSTEVWELAAPEGPEPIFAGRGIFLWKNSKQGAWLEAGFCVNEFGET